MALYVVAVLAPETPSSKNTLSPAPITVARPVPTKQSIPLISAEQLFEDYEENEIAADNRYKGRLFRIEGEVSKIGKDITDQPYIVLNTYNCIFKVQCFLSHTSVEKAGRLVPGDPATLVGTINGKFGNIIVLKCALE